MKRLRQGVWVLVALAAGCRAPLGIVGRVASDYLRLEPGNRWVMVGVSGDTVVFSLSPVGGAGDSLWLWELGPLAYEINQEGDGVYRHLVTLAYRGGEPVILEDRMGLLLPVPFVQGATWKDAWSSRRVFMSDTFHLSRRFHGQVEALTRLTVPAGAFRDVYQIRLTDTLQVRGPARTEEAVLDLRLYFAPQIGLVRMETSEGDTFSLVRTEF